MCLVSFLSKPPKLRPFFIQIIDWCICFHLGHQLPSVSVYIYLKVRSCFIMPLLHLSPILSLFLTRLQHMTLSVGVLRVFSFWFWVILSKTSRDPVTKCLICEGIIHFRLIRWNHFFVMGTNSHMSCGGILIGVGWNIWNKSDFSLCGRQCVGLW